MYLDKHMLLWLILLGMGVSGLIADCDTGRPPRYHSMMPKDSLEKCIIKCNPYKPLGFKLEGYGGCICGFDKDIMDGGTCHNNHEI